MRYLDTHIFIEMFYGNNKRFLCEHESNLSIQRLNESYGIFEGCEKLTKYIFKKISGITLQNGETRCIKFYVNGFKWISNIQIRLYRNNKTNTAASYAADSPILIVNGNNRFAPLILSMNVANNNNDKDIIVGMMHELTHAYEDYNRRVKNKKSIRGRVSDIGYWKNKPVGKYDNDKKFVSYILYYLTDFEVNAYLSELKGELKNCDRHFFSIEEIIDFLKESNIYSNYMAIKDYIDYLKKIKSSTLQTEVLQWVDDLSTLKFKNYKNFINYIDKKYCKIERHMNRIIPKMACEYIDYGNVLANHRGKIR